MDMVPALLDEITIRYIFVRSNFGFDADEDSNLLDFDEFLECLCRIALIIFGGGLTKDCQGGQTGETNRIFSKSAPRPPELLSEAQKHRLFGSHDAMSAHSVPGEHVVRMKTAATTFGNAASMQPVRDWIRRNPQVLFTQK
jgi:hypothetical protein